MSISSVNLDSSTLIDAFAHLQHIESRGITFYASRGESKRVSYAELWRRALCFGHGLQKRGVAPGEPVVLVLPDPEEAIIAIIGSMAVGCPPAPIYPPFDTKGIPAFLRYVGYVGRRSKARHMVVGSQVYPFVGTVPSEVDSIQRVERFASVMQQTPAAPVAVRPEDTAFLQFTSGSTAAPKGVVVTHRNLVANLWMIRTASRMDENSVVCTWLPVYHDMGLIGTVLNAITNFNDLVVLAPRTFLRRPGLWLQTISDHRGTHTAAPNFAYGLCTRRIKNPGDYDLSSMKVFICGAEPIMPETLESFAQHFAPAGLDRGAIVPAYGLAEATLAVTFTPYGIGMLCDEVDSVALGEARRAQPADDGDATATRVPSCGVAMPALQVRIATRDGKVLPDRQVGAVQVKGPSVSPGYVNDPDATADARTPDGWLRTGDLGYLAGGHLYACGRTKDVIILRGRNIYPHDVEATASRIPEVRTGNVVAFGSAANRKEERLVIVAESRKLDSAAYIQRQIRGSVHEALGVTPEDVVIVPPGTLPKTSSGKLKRIEAKRNYEGGNLSASKGSSLAALGVVLRSGVGHMLNRVRSR